MGTRFGLWAEKEEKILYCLATLVVLWRNLGTINKNQVNEAERLIKVTAQILKGAIRNYKHETIGNNNQRNDNGKKSFNKSNDSYLFH